MKKLLLIAPCLLILTFCSSGCSSVDLSLINEVKRFEPEWMNLSETVTFIERNLNLTKRRYEKDFSEVEPFIKSPKSNQRNDLFGLRSQYQNMIEKRDEIEVNFQDQKKSFVKEVDEFNSWVNLLMKNKLRENEAFATYKAYRDKHQVLKTEMEELETSLIKNIQDHNTILKRITSKLKLFSNYDINPK